MNFAKYVYGYFTNIFYAIFRTEYFYATLSLFFVIFNVYIYIMKLTWIQALKKWNESNDGSWCIPRKGSQAYEEVKAIMTGEEKKKETKEKKVKPKKEKKEKKVFKKDEQEEKKEEIKEQNNYIERISLKYSVPIKRIKEIDGHVRQYFIDSGFAKYYKAAHSEPIRMIRKSEQKNNPHGDREYVNEGIAQTNAVIEKAKNIVKPYEKVFLKTMLNPVVCEVFCNIVLDTYLIDIISLNEKFLHTVAAVYGKDMIYIDSDADRERLKKMVLSDSNAEYIKQRDAKNTRRS